MRRLLLMGMVALLLACSGGDGGGSADPAAFCARLDRLTSNDPFAAFGDTASAAEIEQAFGALVDRSAELVDVAPEEARSAARQYAAAAESLDALMAAAGYVGSQVDQRAYRDEQLAYAEAADRLLRYLDAECG